MPGLDGPAPADANEVAEAWRAAIIAPHQPVALVLTRQNVPVIDRARYASAEGLRRGGYVLADPEDGDPEVILIATGSEVALWRSAPTRSCSAKASARASSACPAGSCSTARTTPTATRSCRRRCSARVSVEEGSTLGWDRYVGHAGAAVGMHTFGTSAPLKDVQAKFGFTPDKIAEAAREALEKTENRIREGEAA